MLKQILDPLTCVSLKEKRSCTKSMVPIHWMVGIRNIVFTRIKKEKIRQMNPKGQLYEIVEIHKMFVIIICRTLITSFLPTLLHFYLKAMCSSLFQTISSSKYPISYSNMSSEKANKQVCIRWTDI